jgi:hypothetical protein
MGNPFLYFKWIDRAAPSTLDLAFLRAILESPLHPLCQSSGVGGNHYVRKASAKMFPRRWIAYSVRPARFNAVDHHPVGGSAFAGFRRILRHAVLGGDPPPAAALKFAYCRAGKSAGFAIRSLSITLRFF